MRILVFSDSHGDEAAVLQAVRAQPTAEIVIHLGDGEHDTEEARRSFPDKMFLQVRGNCDFASRLSPTEVRLINGVRLFFTHGHLYNAKFGEDALKEAARQQNADVVLYGHTHRATAYYEDGLYVLNPGSVRGSYGSYGILDITESGIMTNLISFR